nr:unnamed protein product [Callosobruchus chinensis]
MQSREGQLD